MSALAIQSFLGFFFLLGIAFICSENKKFINWKLILTAFIAQNALFLIIHYVPIVNSGLHLLSGGLLKFMDYANKGAGFVFGGLADTSKVGFVFAFVVVPTIIFFGSVISILYFFGIMQWIIEKLAFLLRKTIKLSGVESLVVIADIFLGQSEGPMVIGPYVQNMTRSELACAFVAGLANLSGSTLGMYLSFLAAGDHSEELMFANSLLTATFMNATSAVVFAKMIFPETNYEAIMDAKHLKVTGSKHDSLVDAIMHGAFTGVKIGVAICAALMAVIPLVHAIDGLLFWIGSLVHVNDYIVASSNKSFDGLSLEYLFGLVFRFFAFFMGVSWSETLQVGSLLGQKVAINEFVAYMSLGQMKAAHLLSANSVFISTFALASFSNFSSIGISMGAFSALAPGRQSDLAAMGFKALFAAILAGFMTATVAGFWHSLLG
ncbi:MAG: NupC/NupG family nucleoside CNT transporter [Neisseriales bacterium]|jgi:CNT family concentrative nucleoside transporter|nr:MAG: NupC/NupG family nucleoside CNT transporter [Neisseriales bacterium]